MAASAAPNVLFFKAHDKSVAALCVPIIGRGRNPLDPVLPRRKRLHRHSDLPRFGADVRYSGAHHAAGCVSHHGVAS